jgi:hypothetical protein
MMAAASLGDPQAMIQCSKSLFRGEGCEVDHDAAIALLVEAQDCAGYEGGGGDPVYQASLAKQSLAMLGLDARGNPL